MPFSKTFPVKEEYKFEKRFAMANFFFEEPYVTKVTKDAKISMVGKLVREETLRKLLRYINKSIRQGNIGGTLGLCTGFSIVSIYELVHLALKLNRRAFSSRGRQAKKWNIYVLVVDNVMYSVRIFVLFF